MALWEALRHAPPTGASIADLITATGRSRRWVHYRLQALRRAGKAEPSGNGRWQARTSAPAGPGSEATGRDGDGS